MLLSNNLGNPELDVGRAAISSDQQIKKELKSDEQAVLDEMFRKVGSKQVNC